MTQPIRVVVANRPRLMRELVLETIIDQPDIEIVAEIQNEDEIAQPGVLDANGRDIRRAEGWTILRGA